MSTTVETTSCFLRKRLRDESSSPPDLDRKRGRSHQYYYRLESESSKASEDDTESVYSLQGKETDVVKDSSDTDTNLNISEYEVESFSENEIWAENLDSSSGSENMTLGHLVAAAQAIYDTSSMEKWITDCEESDNSSLDDCTISRSDFSVCAQCKSLNVNPQYRYCEKCYQSCRQCNIQKTYKGFPLCISCYKDRKKFFPPRPRGNKKPRSVKKKSKPPPVKLDYLKSALKCLSQDSGIGSSQEMTSSFPCSDEIVVPQEYLKSGTSATTSSSTTLSTTAKKSRKPSTDGQLKSVDKVSSKDLGSIKNNRKRHISESSVSDFEIKKPKLDEKPLRETSDLGSEISTISFSHPQMEKNILPTRTDECLNTPKSPTESVGKSMVAPSQIEKENSELCIICNNAPKDSIFLHTNIAHQCCCYRCAKRTLHTIKRCPICKRSVNKVVKIYTA